MALRDLTQSGIPILLVAGLIAVLAVAGGSLFVYADGVEDSLRAEIKEVQDLATANTASITLLSVEMRKDFRIRELEAEIELLQLKLPVN